MKIVRLMTSLSVSIQNIIWNYLDIDTLDIIVGEFSDITINTIENALYGLTKGLPVNVDKNQLFIHVVEQEKCMDRKWSDKFSKIWSYIKCDIVNAKPLCAKYKLYNPKAIIQTASIEDVALMLRCCDARMWRYLPISSKIYAQSGPSLRTKMVVWWETGMKIKNSIENLFEESLCASGVEKFKFLKDIGALERCNLSYAFTQINDLNEIYHIMVSMGIDPYSA